MVRWGLIVNKPTEDVRFHDLLRQLDIDITHNRINVPVHYGGPVENGRGFVLHTRDYSSEDSTLEVDHDIGMTATLDILQDISNGTGPAACMLALGYSGWGPGQLESEIQANGWLTCDSSHALVFSDGSHDIWTEAMGSLGIDPRMLSTEGGRA